MTLEGVLSCSEVAQMKQMVNSTLAMKGGSWEGGETGASVSRRGPQSGRERRSPGPHCPAQPRHPRRGGPLPRGTSPAGWPSCG